MDEEPTEATETSHDEEVSETPGEYEETGISREAAAPETSRETPQPKAEQREEHHHVPSVRLISPEFLEKTLVETSLRVFEKLENEKCDPILSKDDMTRNNLNTPQSVPSSVAFATPSFSQHGVSSDDLHSPDLSASSASESEVLPSNYETVVLPSPPLQDSPSPPLQDSPSRARVTFDVVPPKRDDVTQDNLILRQEQPQVQDEEDTIDTIATVEVHMNTRQWSAFSGINNQIKEETLEIELLKQSASQIIAEIKEKIRQQQQELEAFKMGYRQEVKRILETLIPQKWVIQAVEDPLILMLDQKQRPSSRATLDSVADVETSGKWMGPTAEQIFGKELVREINTPYHVLGMYTRRSWDVPRKSFGDDYSPCSPLRMSTKRYSVGSTTAFTPASSSVVTPMRQSCCPLNAPNVFPPSLVPHVHPRTGLPPRPPDGSPSLPLYSRKSFSLPQESSFQAPQRRSQDVAPRHTGRHVPSALPSITESFQCDNISKNYSCQFPFNPPIIFTPPPVGYPSTAETGPHEPPKLLEIFLAEEKVEFKRPPQSRQMSEFPSPPGIIYPDDETPQEIPSLELFGFHPLISFSQAACPPCLGDLLRRTSDSTMGQAGKMFHKWVTNGVRSTLFPCCFKEQNVRITEYWEFQRAEKGPLWVFRGRQIGPVPSDLEDNKQEKVAPSTTHSRKHRPRCVFE